MPESIGVPHAFEPPSDVAALCFINKHRWLSTRQLAGLAEHLFGVPFLADLSQRQWEELKQHLQTELANQKHAREEQKAGKALVAEKTNAA